jgi:hypothetical protein
MRSVRSSLTDDGSCWSMRRVGSSRRKASGTDCRVISSHPSQGFEGPLSRPHRPTSNRSRCRAIAVQHRMRVDATRRLVHISHADEALGCPSKFPSDNSKRPWTRPSDDRRNLLIYLGFRRLACRFKLLVPPSHSMSHWFDPSSAYPQVRGRRTTSTETAGGDTTPPPTVSRSAPGQSSKGTHSRV